MPPPASVRRAFGAVLLTVVATAACTGERPTLGDEAPPSTTAPETTTTTTTTTTAPEPAVIEVAEAKAVSTDVYPTKDAAEPTLQVVAGVDTSVDSIPVVFLVKQRVEGERLQVHLPVGPHGSIGWLERSDVDLKVVTHRIEVAIAEHRLRVFDGEEVVFDEPVSVGLSDRPAPGDAYFLKELVEPPDPGGSYGIYVYGLSGFPPVEPSLNAQGPVVGIHGTDDPDSLGSDVEGGSVGLDNAAIHRLVVDIGLPLGTPVVVLA